MLRLGPLSPPIADVQNVYSTVMRRVWTHGTLPSSRSLYEYTT